MTEQDKQRARPGEIPNAREIKKSMNRQHLIDSAAEAIFRYGFRSTTIANIQEISGLSRGMINLHFQTKENLLLAVAETLASVYKTQWSEVTEDTGLSAAQQLHGIFRVDLSPKILNARDVAIWFAFRSEAVANPAYQDLIGTRTSGFQGSILKICRALTEEGAYPDGNPTLAANCIIALLEGMWTDFHLNSDDFDRQKAEDACLYLARHFFPKHFD